jgi:hypothetical protein
VVNVSAMIVLGSVGAVLADTQKEKGYSGGMPHGGPMEGRLDGDGQGRWRSRRRGGGFACAPRSDEFRPEPASAYERTVGTLKKEF